MDFALGLLVGYFALPLWAMSILFLLFVVDVVLCEADEFGWGISSLVFGVGLVAWISNGINPFTYVWYNMVNVIWFSILYLSLGACWSTFKWWRFSLKGRDRLRRKISDWTGTARTMTKPKRESNTFARYQKDRIMGWIAMWPFSVVGTFIGDFLTKIVRRIYDTLRGIYDAIADSAYKEFEE